VHGLVTQPASQASSSHQTGRLTSAAQHASQHQPLHKAHPAAVGVLGGRQVHGGHAGRQDWVAVASQQTSVGSIGGCTVKSSTRPYTAPRPHLLRHRPSCRSLLGAGVKAVLFLQLGAAGLPGLPSTSPAGSAGGSATASLALSGSFPNWPLLPASCRRRRRRISRAATTAAATAAATTTPTMAHT